MCRLFFKFTFSPCVTVGFPPEDLTLGLHKTRSTAGQWWPAGTTHISDPTLSPCLRKPTCYQALQVTHIHKIYYVRARVGQLNIKQQGCYIHVSKHWPKAKL